MTVNPAPRLSQPAPAREQRGFVATYGYLLAAMFCLSAPVSGFFLGRTFLEAKSSAQWPSVEGKVTRAQSSRTTGKRFIADVEYHYVVEGKEFKGNRICASDCEWETPQAATLVLGKLSPGQKVPIFYNPADPQQSMLKPGAGFSEYALLGVPVVALTLGLVMFYIVSRSRKKAAAAGLIAAR
jgi:hypothetical protein